MSYCLTIHNYSICDQDDGGYDAAAAAAADDDDADDADDDDDAAADDDDAEDDAVDDAVADDDDDDDNDDDEDYDADDYGDNDDDDADADDDDDDDGDDDDEDDDGDDYFPSSGERCAWRDSPSAACPASGGQILPPEWAARTQSLVTDTEPGAYFRHCLGERYPNKVWLFSRRREQRESSACREQL